MTKRKLGALLLATVFTVGLALGAVALIRSGGHETTRVVSQASPESAPTSGTNGTEIARLSPSDVALPTGFSRPSHLTADPRKAGVWFIAESADELRLFNLASPTGSATSYLLGSPEADDLVTVAQNAVMVDDTGLVWVGVNDHLFRVNPANGEIAKADLPPTTSFGSMPVPPDVSNISAITSIARFGTTVAVGTSFATTISFIDASTLKTTAVASIPPGTVSSLAFTSDGALLATDEGVRAAATFSFTGLQILMVNPDTASTSTLRSYPYGALFLHSVGATVDLWEASSDKLDAVGVSLTSGKASLSATPVATLEPGPSPFAVGLDVALSNSVGAIPTHDGATVFDNQGSAVASISLPPVACGEPSAFPISPSLSAPPTSAPSPSGDCSQAALALAVDGSGGVWVVPSGSDALAFAQAN